MNCNPFLCAMPIIKAYQHMHGDVVGIRSRQQFVSPGKAAFPPTQSTDGLRTGSHGRSPRDPLLGLGCAERCRGQPRCKVHPRDYIAHDGVHEHSLVIWIHPYARRSDNFLTNICQMGRSALRWTARPSPLFPLLHRRRQTNRSITIAPLIFQSLTAALHRTVIRFCIGPPFGLPLEFACGTSAISRAWDFPGPAFSVTLVLGSWPQQPANALARSLGAPVGILPTHPHAYGAEAPQLRDGGKHGLHQGSHGSTKAHGSKRVQQHIQQAL